MHIDLSSQYQIVLSQTIKLEFWIYKQLTQPLYILMDLGPVNNRPVYSRPFKEASEIQIEIDYTVPYVSQRIILMEF